MTSRETRIQKGNIHPKIICKIVDRNCPKETKCKENAAGKLEFERSTKRFTSLDS